MHVSKPTHTDELRIACASVHGEELPIHLFVKRAIGVRFRNDRTSVEDRLKRIRRPRVGVGEKRRDARRVERSSGGTDTPLER
jgi:hypothetical protein